MKKLLVLILIIFLAGCSATYDLEIDNDYIKENVVLTFPKEIDKRLLESQTSNPIYVHFNGNEKYDMSESNDNNYYYVKYNYKHKIDNYNNSNFISKCFSDSAIQNSDDIIVIGASGFNCIEMEDDAYLDQVRINIKTNLHVDNNNADEINGNVYTWVFDEGNYIDKSLSIQLKKDNSLSGLIVNVVSNYYILFLVIIFFVILIVIFIKYIIKKNKTSNEL